MKFKKGIGILISLIAISILIPTGNILLTPTEASVTVTSTADPDGAAVKSLTISESSVEIVQGGTHELNAILDCNNYPNENVTWSSSDEDNVEVTTPGSVSVETDAELGDYEITATSVADTSKSATSTIKVVEPLSISSELSDKTVYEGEDASFTVGASGSHLAYQWQVDTGTGAGFTDISDGGGVYSGATTPTLKITGATSDMNGYEYKVVVSGKVLRIYNSFSSSGVSAGYQLTMESSETDLTYQWQVDTGSGFTDISGATESTVIIPWDNYEDSYTYQVIASKKISPVTSNAVLTVKSLEAPSISRNPSDKAVYEGDPASFTVGASGTELTYKWQVDTGSGFEDISDGGVYSGATTSDLDIINATLGMNGYKYRVVINGKVPPAATSNGAVLTVNLLVVPSISSNPSDKAVYAGENASFTVGASGTDLAYKWQVDTGSGFTDISDGGVYSGTTTQVLNITGATLAMNGYTYRVVVSGKALPAATSNGAVLTVTKKSGTSSGGSSSSGSSSSSSSGNKNTDSTNVGTNTASNADDLVEYIIKSLGGEVKTAEGIKTQNGGSAVAAIASINGKNATVVTTNASDKVEVKAVAGNNTVVYVYVKELNAYMPVKSEIAYDKLIFTANPGKVYVVAEANAVTNVVQAGWNRANDSWYVVKEDGSLATGWYKDTNGTWYNLSSEGKMNTGWFHDIDGKWYYLEPKSGRMKTGWIKDSDRKWYYLNTNGSMAYNTYIDGYALGNDGAWIQ